MADLASLRHQLQAGDDVLARALRPSSGIARGDIQEVLSRLEQTVGSLPGGAAAATLREDYARRLAGHKAAFQQAAESGDRERLFEDRAGKPTKHSSAAMKSKDENDQAEVASLLRSRDRMHETFGRMAAAGDGLEKSSSRISDTQDAYNTYSIKLASASKALGHLKKKTEEDSKYIWWSFIFFMITVAYIVLRRLKVFRIIFAGASWTWWSGVLVADVVQSVSLNLAEAYMGISQLLFPPA